MSREQEIEAREKAAHPGKWNWQTDVETKAIVVFDDGEELGGE